LPFTLAFNINGERIDSMTWYEWINIGCAAINASATAAILTITYIRYRNEQ